ncbi:MAG: hypothetical protein P8Y17_00505 [Patescibacteria group bacterium]
MKKKLLVLSVAIILFLSAFLYFYKLEIIPNGFYVDEASVAYNAFSILKTGKDEYGFPHPVFFRLMGSYTPSLFIYLSSLLIKFFGMAPLVFRSISASAALLSILFFYLLIQKMKLYKLKLSYFVITLFYSISPWLVFNARLGYETTLAFLVFNIGAYFLFLAYKKPKNLIPAVIFLSLSTYISHNQRFLAPLFLLGYFIVFRKKLLRKQNTKNILPAILAGIILHIPHFLLLNTKAFWIKSSQFNPKYFWTLLTYLSPKTLFYENPDIDLQHTLPKLSMMFNWMVIPYFIGMYLLIRKIKDYRYKFITIYFAAALLPSLFSSPFISSQKSLPLIIPLSIILGLGIDTMLKIIKPRLRIPLLIIVTAYSLLMLFTSYFFLFPRERASGWNYGYDQIADYIRERPEEKFLLDDTRNPRAYILLLYRLKYDPETYQKELDPFYRDNYYSAPPPATYYHFSNIEVRAIDWKEDPRRKLTIIGDPLSISEQQAEEHNLVKVAEIKDPLMNVIFEIYRADF